MSTQILKKNSPVIWIKEIYITHFFTQGTKTNINIDISKLTNVKYMIPFFLSYLLITKYKITYEIIAAIPRTIPLQLISKE